MGSKWVDSAFYTFQGECMRGREVGDGTINQGGMNHPLTISQKLDGFGDVIMVEMAKADLLIHDSGRVKGEVRTNSPTL